MISRKAARVMAAVLASAIFLALFIGLFASQKFSEGRAVYIGSVPWAGGVVDLTEEESVTFTALPDEAGKEIVIRTGVHPYDEKLLDYRLRVFKVDGSSYGYSLGKAVERDLLLDGGTELVYLNGDAAPDMEIAYRHGRIRFKSLHYLPPEAARIKLLANGTEMPSVISLTRGQRFEAVIEAESSLPPQLAVNLGNLSRVVEVPAENKTTAMFSFTGNEPAQLIITATVRELASQAYYTLAVDDTLYRLAEANFPVQKLTLTEGGAEWEITFLPSRELQPLAPSCLAEKKLGEWLDSSVKRLYSYSGGEPKVWNRGGASDFDQLELFQGYFAELERAEEKKVKTDCRVSNIQTLSGLPDGEARTRRLAAGWNLFSLPGVAERKLTDFTFSRDFRLFECRLGYVCEEIDSGSLLSPGKPYWLYSAGGLEINYRMG